MALALSHNKEYNGHEIVIERPDGTHITALAHANPVHDDSGSLVGAINVLVDISERKMLENALRVVDRQKDEFLAMLAHELRNPLAPILNSAHILSMRYDDQAVVRRQQETIERNAQHLSRLVEDLLEVSRINKGKIELRVSRINLADIVAQAIDCVAPHVEQAGHSLSVSVPLHAVYLQADPVRLVQVLVNLLANAVKYTDAGGRISLAAARCDDEAVITVRDDGRGIEPELLDQVFQLFVQGDRTLAHSQGGLGVGLTLVKCLVELHGGTVSVTSAGPGKGSEFTVRLPAEADGAGGVQSSSSAGETDLESPIRVLVIEDNLDVADTLGSLLTLWGYATCIIDNGSEALEVAHQFRPDLVLLDIGLPGLNGYEVARRLKADADLQHAKIIGVSGYSDAQHLHQIEQSGFDHQLTKPVDPAALRDLLARLVEVKPETTEAEDA